MVSHLRARKRKSRCTSAQNKQQADHPDRLCLPQGIQRRSSSTSVDSNRHRDRTLFSNIGSQQSNNDGLLYQQHHSIHHGDRQNISNTTEWQRTLPQITSTSSSSKGSRHFHKTFTSIQLTEPRQHRESTQNTLWTSESHQGTPEHPLQHPCGNATSHHAMDCEAQCFSHQQLPHPQWRSIKLLQKMENRQQDTHLWIWGKHPLHASNSSEAVSEAGKSILQRNLARKGHIVRRILHRDSRQGHQSKDHQKTSETVEVQQTVDGRHQRNTVGTKPINIQPEVHLTKHTSNSTEGDSRQRHHSRSRNTSNRWSDNSGRRTDNKETTDSNDNITTGSGSIRINDANRRQHRNAGSSSGRQFIIPTWIGRQHHGRKFVETTKDNRRTPRERETGGITGTSAVKRKNQRHHSEFEEWTTGDNSNVWRSEWSSDGTTAARADHQGLSRIRSGEDETRNDQGNDINGETRSVWRNHHRRSNRGRKEKHHWIKVGPSQQRRWSQITHRRPRLRRSDQGRGRHLRVNAALCDPQGHPVHRIGSRLEHQGRRHQHSISTRIDWSNIQHSTQATSRILHQQKHPLEIEESNVWPTVIAKGMAGSSSSDSARVGLHQTQVWTQRLQTSRRTSIHHGLRWRSSLCRRDGRDRQHLQEDSGEDATQTNRRSITRKDHLISGTKDHQPRRSFRHQSWERLHEQHPGGDESTQQLQPSNNHRNNSRKRKHRRRATSWPTGTSAVPQIGRQTAVAGLHQARHQFCNKRTSKSTTTTNHQGPEETTTSGQVSCRYQRLPVQHSSISLLDEGLATVGLEHLRWFGLGRMPSNQKEHHRFYHRVPWHLHPLWIKNTGSRGTVIRRSGVLRHRNRSPRIAIHQELHHWSSEQQAHQHPHTHRQLSRKINGDTPRGIKTCKAHRTQIHVHPEPHPRRRGIFAQDPRQRQSSRHPYQIRDSRSAEMAHLQHRYQPTVTPSCSRYHQYHQYVKHTSANRHQQAG